MAAAVVTAARVRGMSASARVAPAYVAKTEIVYAGFWRRFLAFVIDYVLMLGVELALLSAVYVFTPDTIQAIQGGDRLRALAEVGPVVSAISWAYYGILESSPARGTLGKIALGLYVGDARGDPISFRRAAYRNWLKLFSWLTLGAGFVLAGVTPRKQTLHDLVGGTLVLRKKNYLAFGPQPPTEPGDHWDGTRWIASVPPMENS